MDDLVKLVEQLVNGKSEGVWWDFKQKHHENPIALLHDILCLANVMSEKDRFIIFGVSDDYDIKGLSGEGLRRTQADVSDFLRSKSFAYHNIPKVTIHTIQIDGKELDVLTIKNENCKPYFLTKDEPNRGATVIRAGTVYSRMMDSNTPKNSSANPNEIEQMWYQRFGLNKTASERFIDVLLDVNNWKYNGVDKAFYDVDSDYTLAIGESERSRGYFWWEKELFDKPYRKIYFLRYKGIDIHEIPVVVFTEENLSVPFPKVETVTYPEKGDGLNADIYCDLFYYLKNTIEYSLFRHIRLLEVPEITIETFSTPIETQLKPPILQLPFLILESEERLRLACNKLISCYDNFLTERITLNKAKNNGANERLFTEWAHNIIVGENNM